MRKLTFLTTFILTLIISSGTIFGQRYRTRDAEYFPKHELYVQYGTPTILELTSTLSPPTIEGQAKMGAKDVVFSGVGGIGYNFSVTERFSFGVYGGISLASADIYSSVNEVETAQYSSDIVSYTGQVSAHLIYYESGAIQISSGAYIGINYRDDTIKHLIERPTQALPKIETFKFSYHLTAIKVRYGNIVGGFAELGFGFRGLVNIGLSVKM